MDPSKMNRWRATAETWTRKTVALLRCEAKEARNDDERWLAGYDSERLMSALIGEVQLLVPLLQEDQLSEAEEGARVLAAALRARRLSLRLGNIEGRTEAEAEMFAAAAARFEARARG
jgi:hypothetical protein